MVRADETRYPPVEVLVAGGGTAGIAAATGLHSFFNIFAAHERVDRMRVVGGAGQVAMAIEVPRGALVETLIERGFHVYVINPKQVDRFRDRHTAAGAKDDRRDAYVLADALRTDLRTHRIHRYDAWQVLEVVRQEPLWCAPGAVDAAREHVELLLPHLRIVHEQRKGCERRLRELLEEYAAEEEDDLGDAPGSLPRPRN